MRMRLDRLVRGPRLARGPRTSVSLLVVLVLAGFAASPSALGAPRARMLHLNWVERQTPNIFPVQMTFHVYWVRIAGSRWTVRAAFTNKSSKTLRVFPEEWGDGTPTPDYGFSILDIPHEEYSVNASGSSPRIPKLIKPGMTWSGTFFGTHAGWLPRHITLQISFGYFRLVGGGGGFSWVTQHTFRL